MYSSHYIIKSLELHIFFGRIMKEHSLFLKAGFTPAEPDCIEKAAFYQTEFESLLLQAVTLGDGIVSKEAICANEFVTEFTALAEKQTERLTGICIDKEITEKTLCLSSAQRNAPTNELHRQVHRLNQKALQLLDGLISFKETILQCVLRCEMFTVNYPLLIEHILREAKLYRKYIQTLEKEGRLTNQSMKDVECFWNQIMMEHAQFIRGLLDPCETELYDTADKFAKRYCALLEASRSAHRRTLTAVSLEQTEAFRDFKATGAEGIQQCRIRSIILPLLADHVLREANHYIRLLKA